MQYQHLLDPFLQAAMKAAGTMAAKRGAAVAAEYLKSIDVGTKLLRGLGDWSVLKLTRHQHKKMTRFLSGKTCSSILELLVISEFSEKHSREIKRKQLGDAFRHEGKRAAKAFGDEADQYFAAMWVDLSRAVELYISELRRADYIPQGRTKYLTALSSFRGPESTSRHPDVFGRRADLAQHYERTDRAMALAHSINMSARRKFERMWIPHIRSEVRLKLEDLYVARWLQDEEYRRDLTRITLQSIIDKVRTGATMSRDEASAIIEEELSDRCYVVVGNPGAGKSSYVRHLIHRLAAHEDPRDPDFATPLLISLKEHQTASVDYTTVLANTVSTATQSPVTVTEISDILNLGLGVVIFDGLDEVGNLHNRKQVAELIEEFSYTYPLTTIVVTCRIESYRSVKLDHSIFRVYVLPDFDGSQVIEYTSKWFKLIYDSSHDGTSAADRFLTETRQISDLRSNPLMLSLLCDLYQYSGYIPENRADVYGECAELMLSRWENVNQIPHSLRSYKLARFLVEELAQYFFLELEGREHAPESDLRKVLVRHLEDRDEESDRSFREQAQEFLDFCSERVWLISQTSVGSFGERIYGFTHRTFMEYHTARYILRNSSTLEDLVRQLLILIETGRSFVVAQLAVQIFDERLTRGAESILLKLIDKIDPGERFTQGREVVNFCLVYLRDNALSRSVLSNLCPIAFELIGAHGVRDTYSLMRSLSDRSLMTINTVADEVVRSSIKDSLHHADRRAGAILFTQIDGVEEERAAARARIGELSVDSYLSTHSIRSLVITIDDSHTTPRQVSAGPILTGVKDRLSSHNASYWSREMLDESLVRISENPNDLIRTKLPAESVDIFSRYLLCRAIDAYEEAFPLHHWKLSAISSGFYGVLSLGIAATFEAGDPAVLGRMGLASLNCPTRHETAVLLVSMCERSGLRKDWSHTLLEWGAERLSILT
ncbi:NACHT domain-containing protein [Actinokineospora guangxiensis]|uniref:NACHT domain-containing protein n=1 Tax=Actinokineospora guangxiensis TaxID=1490288 RepID=A0ABW0EL84_9PSEU